MVDGVLLRVSKDFDEAPGSEDMVAAAALVEHMRGGVERSASDEFVTKHGRRS